MISLAIMKVFISKDQGTGPKNTQYTGCYDSTAYKESFYIKGSKGIGSQNTQDTCCYDSTAYNECFYIQELRV